MRFALPNGGLEKRDPLLMKYHHLEIPIPSNVHIVQKDHSLWFQGPLGSICMDLSTLDPYGIAFWKIRPEDHAIDLMLNGSHAKAKSMSRSIRTKLRKTIEGITRGVFVSLVFVGVGYRAQVNSDSSSIDLKLGYSHPIQYPIDPTFRVVQKKPTELSLYGIDHHHISQIASNLRDYRRPEPYKGKGIRYTHESISLKVGKKK